MATHGNQPTAQTEEEAGNQSSAEQDTQKQQLENFQEAAPEDAALSELLQFAGASILTLDSKYSNLAAAFDAINNPNFQYEILKVMDPEKLSRLKRELKIVEEKVKNQRKAGKDEATVGFWIYKRKIKINDLDNKKQALGIAEAVQNRIDITELKYRLTNANQLYGLADGTLQKDLAGWLKANPGRNLDEYIKEHGGKLYRENIKKESKEPEKNIDEKVEKFNNENARKQAVKKSKDQIIRGQQEIKRLSLLTDLQSIPREEQLRHVYKGTPAPPIHIPTPVQLPGGFTIPNVPLMPSFGGFKSGLNILGSGFGKLFGGRLGYIGKRGPGRFLNLAGKLGKRALNRALDAFMPGLGMAVGKINDVIKSILGIDVEATIIKGAAIFVGAVGAIVLILPIIIGVGVLSYVTGNNPMKIPLSNGKPLVWNEFDKQYLTTQSNALALDSSVIPQNDKKITWKQFEDENLLFDKKYLSLDANRHDDVKK